MIFWLMLEVVKLCERQHNGALKDTPTVGRRLLLSVLAEVVSIMIKLCSVIISITSMPK